MYTDSTLKPINDGAVYVAPNGTQYPGNFPKANIPGLHAVTLTDEPTDPSLVVTGFVIDDAYTQVWQTRSKTSDELAANAVSVQNALADYRNSVETGGIMIGGANIGTDQQTRANLIAAYIKAKEDNAYSVEWKTAGGFVTLNATMIVAVADAVAAHVQKAFATEASVLALNPFPSTVAAVKAAFDTEFAS